MIKMGRKRWSRQARKMGMRDWALGEEEEACENIREEGGTSGC